MGCFTHDLVDKLLAQLDPAAAAAGGSAARRGSARAGQPPVQGPLAAAATDLAALQAVLQAAGVDPTALQAAM